MPLITRGNLLYCGVWLPVRYFVWVSSLAERSPLAAGPAGIDKHWMGTCQTVCWCLLVYISLHLHFIHYSWVILGLSLLSLVPPMFVVDILLAPQARRQAAVNGRIYRGPASWWPTTAPGGWWFMVIPLDVFFGDGGRTLQGFFTFFFMFFPLDVGEVGDPQPTWCSDQWISHVQPASDFEENAIPPVFPPMLGGNEMGNPWFPRRNSEIIFSQETIQEWHEWWILMCIYIYK